MTKAQKTARKRLSCFTLRHLGVAVGVLAVASTASLWIATAAGLRATPDTLDVARRSTTRARLLARSGEPLSVTYRNRWNVHETLTLYEMPQLLRAAFRHAEDQRFYDHAGVDWRARAHAAWQNLNAGGVVRGASTITEQVVRMLKPRPRTLWSRWLEGFEATRLEKRFGKNAIFELYLNQVPYAANRRGVVQAARYYFDRDVTTLNSKETLALAVLVRAPSRLDLRANRHAVDAAVGRLSQRLARAGVLDERELASIETAPLALARASLPVQAPHFARHVHGLHAGGAESVVQTTLDPVLQRVVQQTLAQRLAALAGREVSNAAALVVDHEHNEILAWAVSSRAARRSAGEYIDAVTTPRQPGSTLKPFLYAMALEGGFNAATLIEDAPLAQAVGAGLHSYRNYSRRHYGRVTVRQALGNSLNIPAVRTLQFVGAAPFLGKLRELGLKELTHHPDVYGDGLALGNGEVSLLHLVQAYTALANGGRLTPLTLRLHDRQTRASRQVFTPEAASLIADILSDREARALEFGRGGVLDFPVQTAVKTGTSSDYKDAWAIAFNHRYTAGVWFGNLDRRSMNDVTGALGPAPVLRSVFAHLNRRGGTKPLYLSPRLERAHVCVPSDTQVRAPCRRRQEWFLPGAVPVLDTVRRMPSAARIRHPSDGLQLAMDPRIPNAREMFRFALDDEQDYGPVAWYVNDELAAKTDAPIYLWPLRRGAHVVYAKAQIEGSGTTVTTRPVRFSVK